MKNLVFKTPKSKGIHERCFSKISLSIALTFLFLPMPGHSQGSEMGLCNYTVSYDLISTTEYAVPNELNMEEISPFDLAKARPYVQHSHVVSCIDIDNKLSEETTYEEPALNPEKWMDQTYRILVAPTGTSLFGKEGNLQYYFPNDEYSEEVTLLPEEIEEFGFDLPISNLTIELQTYLEGEGLSVVQLENGVYAINSLDQEVIYNVEKQSIEERNYENGVLTHSELIQYQTVSNGLNIPIYKIKHFYEPMLNGGFMRISTYSIYSNYTVQGSNFDNPDINALVLESQEQKSALNHMLEQGKGADILSVPFGETEMDKLFELSISPNPAIDVLKVKLPKMGIDNTVNLQIINTSGQVVHNRVNLTINEYHEINISALNSGLYILRVNKNGNQQQVKFVKH